MRCAASRAWRSGRLALLLLLLFSTTALVAQEKTSTLKVVGVHDGDSITCLNDDKRQLKVRLDAIDAPELGQPFGQASKKALSDLVFGKTVTVIDRLPKNELFLKELTTKLKKRCGTGGTYLTSGKDGVIEIQGDHRESIRAHLAKEGISSKG